MLERPSAADALSTLKVVWTSHPRAPRTAPRRAQRSARARAPVRSRRGCARVCELLGTATARAALACRSARRACRSVRNAALGVRDASPTLPRCQRRDGSLTASEPTSTVLPAARRADGAIDGAHRPDAGAPALLAGVRRRPGTDTHSGPLRPVQHRWASWHRGAQRARHSAQRPAGASVTHRPKMGTPARRTAARAGGVRARDELTRSRGR